jgi:hypothetical protein
MANRVSSMGVLPVLLLSALGACSGGTTIEDDFRGPRGYSRIQGQVLTSDGSGGPEGMEVALARCGHPVGGLAGTGSTGPGGEFTVLGALPPFGLPEGADSVLVTCELVAGRGFAESGPLEVYFFPADREPSVLWVELRAGVEP